MKILLTGAGGQLGKALTAGASSADDVIAYTKAQLDITNLAAVHQLVAAIQPDIIINAAAYTNVDLAEQELDLAFAINSTGVKNLALIGKKFNLPLLHISSDYVFSGTKQTAYLETDPCNPINAYGASKVAGEKILSAIWHKSLVLRVSWVFSEYGNNFVKKILALAQTQTVINIVSDQIGCPTSAHSIAQVLLCLAHKLFTKSQNHWGIFHYRGDQLLSWYDFAQLILLQYSKYNPRVPKVHPILAAAFPAQAMRPKNSLLDITKINHIYGIKPHSVTDAVKQVVLAWHGKDANLS